MRIMILVSFFVSMSIVLTTHPKVAGAQGIWSTDSSTGFYGRAVFSSDTINGQIFVIGGNRTNDTLQIFDPVSHKWSTPTTSGSVNALYLQSTLAREHNGKLYIIEIYSSNSHFSDSVKVFDPASSTWSNIVTSGVFTPREGACVASLDGKLYVIGGDTLDFYYPTNILEVFDPSTNTWSRPVTTGEFRPVIDGTCSVVDGKLYVIGSGVNVFDPSTNTWSTPFTTGIFQGADNATSSALNGKIYVFGGGGSWSSDAAQVFDLATNSWDSVTSMPTARSGLSSCVVDGKIYVLGGYTPHRELNTVEVFTPGPPNSVPSPPGSPSFDFSPNPTEGIITIHDANIEHITVENLLGRSVLEAAAPRSPEFTLDLTKLPAGLYFARFEMAGTVVMRKIVKE